MTNIADLPAALHGDTLPGERDLEAATRAAEDFLRALGVACGSESMAKSPRRMAEAYAELFTPRLFEMTTFPNDENYDELVVVGSIPVQSVCEHHFLPFTGVAHVGYLPDDRIVGLSKLARVVEMFARRPQTQERLTQQVANFLDAHLSPKGVGVVIEAEHTCMTLRGVRVTGTTTSTSALKGVLRERPQSRAEFFACIPTGA
ncbi:GTP cyclohydrolase I FolE [Aeromicrobium sp. A1-2]|uniref:GTP cyclohydrolase I FolE n=1 Tax=Aeromicrobium sp. A1-2 TaxID=2107713 RepID=UPI000E4F94DC|nr:GTP cyclohydrolase I FolE [Aeromicrobium sp. A1-2]AXT85239.1 GTP cyclohydrolase I FolE [Aeromicrobium sp. A1-2]